MKNDRKLETCHFRLPLFLNKKPVWEQLFQKNHKNGSWPKDFNRNTDTYNTSTPQDTIYFHWPKVNSVRFEEPYEYINPMSNSHE